MAVAINTGTNIPSIATPNGQAAFLFLLTSAIAPLIRLSYFRMVWMALPHFITMTEESCARGRSLVAHQARLCVVYLALEIVQHVVSDTAFLPQVDQRVALCGRAAEPQACLAVERERAIRAIA